MRIRWTNHKEMRNGTQGSKVLYRLMCWTVFTQANGIVCENVDHLNFGKRRQANSRLQPAAEQPPALVGGDAPDHPGGREAWHG